MHRRENRKIHLQINIPPNSIFLPQKPYEGDHFYSGIFHISDN